MRSLPVWNGPVRRLGGSPPSGPVPLDPPPVPGLTRRQFVTRGALCGSALWLLASLPRSLSLRAAQGSTERLTFTRDEWQLVEAMTGRLIPTDSEPGAIEAGCVNFIDKALAYEEVRYQGVYAAGLKLVERHSAARFGAPFVELEAAEQDEILSALEAGEIRQAAEVDPWEFFEVLRLHTIIGFLADPLHGGNRDYAGWRVIGYPGQHHEDGGFTAEQLVGEQKIRTAWGTEID